SAGLAGDQPEKMQRIDLVGIHLQDLLGELLRLPQVACLVVLPGHIERLLNRDHGSSSAASWPADTACPIRRTPARRPKPRAGPPFPTRSSAISPCTGRVHGP